MTGVLGQDPMPLRGFHLLRGLALRPRLPVVTGLHHGVCEVVRIRHGHGGQLIDQGWVVLERHQLRRLVQV